MDKTERAIETVKKEEVDELEDFVKQPNVECTPQVGRGDAKTKSADTRSSPTGSADVKMHDEEDGPLQPSKSVYVPRVIREKLANSIQPLSSINVNRLKTNKNRSRLDQRVLGLSPLDRTGWTPPSDRRSAAPTSARRGPILEVQEPMPPLHVVYSNNVPDDVELNHYRMNSRRAHRMSAKIYIPKIDGYNFIGRILGPHGISVRHLESQTTCKILIRGKGSVKDPRREEQLMRKEGWSHLHEDLHVLVAAYDDANSRCRERLEYAVGSIQRLLIPQYDEYKRQQLVQLAIINGTYRP